MNRLGEMAGIWVCASIGAIEGPKVASTWDNELLLFRLTGTTVNNINAMSTAGAHVMVDPVHSVELFDQFIIQQRTTASVNAL